MFPFWYSSTSKLCAKNSIFYISTLFRGEWVMKNWSSFIFSDIQATYAEMIDQEQDSLGITRRTVCHIEKAESQHLVGVSAMLSEKLLRIWKVFVIRKVSGISQKYPNNLENVRTIWKASEWYGKYLCKRTIITYKNIQQADSILDYFIFLLYQQHFENVIYIIYMHFFQIWQMRSIQRDFANKILLSRICFLFIKCQSSLTPVRLQPDV